jgi:hypothetical protein
MLLSTWDCVINPNKLEKDRLFYIAGIRNNPYPQMVDDILVSLTNDSEPLTIRIALAEALGWYNYSSRKNDIILACQKIINNEIKLDENLKEEILKTSNRLKTYMK